MLHEEILTRTAVIKPAHAEVLSSVECLNGIEREDFHRAVETKATFYIWGAIPEVESFIFCSGIGVPSVTQVVFQPPGEEDAIRVDFDYPLATPETAGREDLIPSLHEDIVVQNMGFQSRGRIEADRKHGSHYTRTQKYGDIAENCEGVTCEDA